MLDKTITITCFNRPAYLERVLETLICNDLTHWRLLIGVEPSDRRKEILEVIASTLPAGIEAEIILNIRQLGVLEHPHQLISRAFRSGSDLNIYLEDDTIVSPDLTRIAQWYASLDHEKLVCLNLMHGECGGRHHVSIDLPGMLLATKHFNSLGFVLTPGQWESHFKPHWFDSWRGWDWSILDLVARSSDLKTLQPLCPRANHIGRDGGTYCAPEFHDSVFPGLAMNLRAEGFEYSLEEGSHRDFLNHLGSSPANQSP